MIQGAQEAEGAQPQGLTVVPNTPESEPLGTNDKHGFPVLLNQHLGGCG
jgi:hypothetical protein